MSDDARSGSGTPAQRRWPGILARVALVVLVGAVLWFVFSQVDFRAVADAVADLPAVAWAALVALAALRLLAEAAVFVALTPGLSWPHALAGFLAPTAAASALPGPVDVPARFAMYRSWGISVTTTSAALVAAFVFTMGTRLLLPALAAAALFVLGRSTAEVESIGIAAAGVVLAAAVAVVAMLRSEQLARRIGHLGGRAAQRLAALFRLPAPETLAADLADKAAHFHSTVGSLVRGRWHLALAAAVAVQITMFAILLVAIRGVGITAAELHWAEVFAAFALVQLITVVPITPGSIGVAEAALVAVLAAELNRDLLDQVTAAALIYRTFTWLIVIPLGAAVWLEWSRGLRRRLRADTVVSAEEEPERE